MKGRFMLNDLPWVLTLGQAAESAGGGDVMAPATTAPAPVAPAAPPATEGVEGQSAAPVAPGTAPKPQQGPLNIWPLLIIMIAVLWFMMIMPQRKEKKKRQQMLAALAKGDRVQTVGGIIGSVIEIREQEIVLKVDENSNTRMRFSRSAIQSVISSGGES